MKKKLILALTILFVVFMIVGCAKTENQSNANATTDSKVLVVYYSLTGSTEKLATTIAEKAGAALFKLEPVTPYVMDTVSEEKQAEIDSNTIRDLKGELPNIEEYDIILIGGPVWNGIAANPILKYLEETDFNGKTVSAFYTAASSVGEYSNEFASLVNNGKVVEGLGLLTNQLSDTKKIDDWLKSILD